MFLKECRFEKELPYNGQKSEGDSKIQTQKEIWKVRKYGLLEKYSEKENFK